MTSFVDKLNNRVEEVNSLLCIGLDPHSKEIVTESVKTADDRCEAAFAFCKKLIDATLPYAACYKPNAAFFEALGEKGTQTLDRVMKEIPSNVPILLDVKRGDIGSTATAYAEACYDHLNADAVTLSPLMGWDSVAPFVTGMRVQYLTALKVSLSFHLTHLPPLHLNLAEKYSGKGAFVLCKTSNPGTCITAYMGKSFSLAFSYFIAVLNLLLPPHINVC